MAPSFDLHAVTVIVGGRAKAIVWISCIRNELALGRVVESRSADAAEMLPRVAMLHQPTSSDLFPIAVLA